MPLIDEDTAFGFAQKHMSMQPDKVDPLEVRALDEYATHQQELGLPMFPTNEAKARVEKEGYYSVFTDIKKVDEWEPTMKQIAANATDPDNVRQMFANSMFLATELGLGKDEVLSKYQDYLGAYSQKVWGKRVADTAGFYGMAQGHVKKQVEAEEVSGEAMRLALTSAALGTNDSVGDYQKWKESMAGKAPTEDAHWAFSVTYGKVKSQIDPFKPVVAGAVKSLKQMMAGEGATAGTEQRIVDAIVDLDPEVRPLVLSAIMAGAGATGEGADKDWKTLFPQIGEAFSRILTSSYKGIGRKELGQNMITVRQEYLGGKDGKMLLPESAVTSPEQARDLVRETLFKVIGKKTSLMQMGMGASTGMGGGPVYVPPLAGGERRYREPTEQERKLINSELNRVTRIDQITREIENAAVATDPVKALFANAIGSTLALVPMSMLGPGGVMVAAQAYSGMEYDKIRLQYPTIPEDKVAMISDLSGLVMAGLDKIEGDFLTGKLPSVSKIIQKGIFSTVIGRVGVRAVEGAIFQNTQEGLQDVSRLVIQDIASAIDSDIEGTDLSEYVEFWDSRMDVAIDMIPLNLMGLGAGTYNDFANATELMQRRDRLNLAGINDEAAGPIIDLASRGDVEGAQAALREAFLNRDPEVARAASERMGPAEVAKQGFDTLLTRTFTPRYTQEGDNHILTFPDGRVIKAESWGEARWYIEQAMGDKLGEEIATVADMANFFTSQQRAGIEERVDISPERRTQQQEVEAGTITEEQARERAAIAGEAFGLTPEEAQEETWTVLGRNTVDTQEEVAKSAIDLFEGAGVDTVVEEVVEGRLKVALEKQRYSLDEVRGFIAQVESATNEKFLVNDTEQGIIEAISAIVVADVIGRRKDGTQLPAGLVTRGMLQAVQRQSTPQANRKLMGMVQAFRSFFRQVFARARSLTKAKAEGKLGTEYQGFVDELLGVDPQVRELNAAATEARAMVGEVTGEAKTEEVSTKQANQMKGLGVVRYAGVTGRLERLGEWYVIKPKEGPEVELSGEDFVDVVFETDPATLEEFNKPEPVESDGRTGAPTVEPTTGFTPARDGTLAITTPDGRTLVPVKRELAKNIVKNRRGTGFKLKDVNDKYGDRAVTLYGAEANQAIDAMLEAAANVESMGRKVSYSLGRAVPQDSSNVTVMPDGAKLVGPTTYSIRAYHGTPHKVDKFALDKIGTGEGAQAYGWGLYFAESKGIANFYKETLSRTADGSNTPTYKGANASVWRSMRGMPEQSDVLYILALMEQQKFSAEQALDYAKDDIESDLQATDFVVPTEGNLYTVNLLPNEEEFLDWDKPLSEQSQKIQDELFVEFGELYSPDKTGGEWYREMTQDDTDPQTLSKDLARIGIPGFKYLDATSRDGGSGTSNFVIFDESLVEILEENGQKVSYSLGRATPQDTEYLAAVERGDMATAQRMVDEAARAAGYNVGPVWRADISKTDVYELDKLADSTGFFFFPNKEDAENWAESLVWRGKSKAPSLTQAFLKMDNPRDGARIAGASNSEARARMIAEGYDSATHLGGRELVVFNSNQIKSADPVTYDAQGNVIPLSQRFNPQDNRITYALGRATPQDQEYLAAVERNDIETAQRMVDEAARAAGFNITSWHGSNQPSANFSYYLAGRGGYRFFSNKEYAETYAGKDGTMRRSFLMTLKPFNIRNESGSKDYTAKEAADLLTSRGLDVSGIEFKEKSPLWSQMQSQGVKQSLEKAGFDSVVISETDDGDMTRMVFNPNQIKSADPVTYDANGNIIPLSQRFNPQDNRITYALAPAKFSEQVMTELEQQLGKDPAQRWAFGVEIQRRLAKLSTEVDAMAAADLTSKQRKDQQEQFVREKFDELVAQMPPNQPVEELEKVMAQAKKEGEAWAKQNKADAPGQRERIIGYQRIVNAALMGLPKNLRTDIGGFLQVADARSATTALRAIKKHIARIGETVERYLKEEIQAEVKALIKRGKPNMKAGEKPSSDIGAEASNLFAVAAAAIKMNEVETLRAISDREDEIDNPDLKPTLEREQQLRDEIEIINLAGDFSKADAAQSKALLDTLQNIYDGGYLVRLDKLNRDKAKIERLKDMIKSEVMGKLGIDSVQGLQAAIAQQRTKGTASTWWDVAILEGGSFNTLLYKLVGENSEVAKELLNMERKADNDYQDLNDAMEQDITAFFTRIGNGDAVQGQRIVAAMAVNTKKGFFWKKVKALGQTPVRHTIKVPGKADAVEVTSQMEAIHDLMMWRQPDGKRNMSGKFNDLGERTSTWGYDEDWANSVMGQLTPEAWQVMDWLTQRYQAEGVFLDPLVRDRLGVMMPANPIYSPLTNVSEQVKPGQMQDPISGSVVNGTVGITPTALKTRNKSINRPRKANALQVYIGHTKQMNHWVAKYDYARTIQQLFLNRDMLDYVQASGGEVAQKLILAWVDHAVAGGIRDATVQLEFGKFFDRMGSRAAQAAILGRASTLMVQTTQLAAASMRMPMRDFIRLSTKLYTGQLDWSATINSPFIQRRIAQKSPLVQRAMQANLSAGVPSNLKYSQRWFASALTNSDAYVTAATHTMLYHHQLEVAESMGLIGAEAKEYAASEADRLTEEVAQPVRQSQRSMIELNKKFSFISPFISEARQKLSLLFVALDKVKQDPSWDNWGELARVSNYLFLVNGMFVQAIKKGWLLARTPADDRPEIDIGEMLLMMAAESLASPLTGAPGFQFLTEGGSLLSALPRAGGAFGRVSKALLTDESVYDGDPVKMMRDADLLISAMSLFSDSAAVMSSYSHVFTDLAKLIDAQTQD